MHTECGHHPITAPSPSHHAPLNAYTALRRTTDRNPSLSTWWSESGCEQMLQARAIFGFLSPTTRAKASRDNSRTLHPEEVAGSSLSQGFKTPTPLRDGVVTLTTCAAEPRHSSKKEDATSCNPVDAGCEGSRAADARVPSQAGSFAWAETRCHSSRLLMQALAIHVMKERPPSRREWGQSGGRARRRPVLRGKEESSWGFDDVHNAKFWT
ncbi:uncharacterized protein LY79DRAFT_576807 [Colletotrichum navitas]|uniref:Uncharacterized protein n=1 Tax=Colletotrichum navitas TaxID=681940 RepID=A0AAD8Q6X7_9PEZI|nr:uncharacterized protein LY79DRAFT_576807 [Colletotrichum navitas]KAK1597046.1 hypothetical protein LY79DRAFT_576807 [Colletotrichum navitas]